MGGQMFNLIILSMPDGKDYVAITPFDVGGNTISVHKTLEEAQFALEQYCEVTGLPQYSMFNNGD